jgi:hypothetical protein
MKKSKLYNSRQISVYGRKRAIQYLILVKTEQQICRQYGLDCNLLQRWRRYLILVLQKQTAHTDLNIEINTPKKRSIIIYPFVQARPSVA